MANNTCKNFVVTGAAGFTGSGIVQHLVKQHKCNVLAVSRRPVEYNLDGQWKNLFGIDLLKHDDLVKLDTAVYNRFMS